ncbi:unnamed protein product [Peronospora farinosa]|uniref:Uncharacterized protein n=1 Tax=Peronospora farinosa TaxID=134698 RepID=A0ABN8BYZ3_9STRA|nr:unnamed protein product [Peronospora farinosa]
MKRLATPPITAFFQRKQVRRISIESIDSSNGSYNDAMNSSIQECSNDAVEAVEDEEEMQNQVIVKRITRVHREDLLGILQYREFVGCATTRHLSGGIQTFRRRRKQQLIRWTLTNFQKLPMELQLVPHWYRQAGVMCSELFYASCMAFDAGGVLLVAGASNGIIALYDFDDVFHRSLNLGQRLLQNSEAKDDEEGDKEQQEPKMTDEILHPIHMIFTSYEVKCIRWNPLDEDEIACSFTNRNEIHIYNLGKFPSKPHKVLKSSNHPSKGYNDLVYLTATEKTMPNSQSKVVHVVAGDIDGAIRMWDLRFPLQPVYSFLTGSLKTPINSLVLSPNKQFLICGNEAGIVMTYDIQHKIVPAFGSKPVPQQKAVVNIMEAIKPYLSPALIETVLLTSRYRSSGIMSLCLIPESETQVLCQLRNDWVVVIDYLRGTVMKLHTFVREVLPRDKLKSDASPSVLSMGSESEYQRDFFRRNSWLSCHRCTGTFLLDKSILCTGIHDTTSLTMIDLHQLQHITAFTTTIDETSDADKFRVAHSGIYGKVPTVERLDRFQIPMNDIITTVAAHPNQHLIICGGQSMKFQIMGLMGKHESTIARKGH